MGHHIKGLLYVKEYGTHLYVLFQDPMPFISYSQQG